MKRILILLLAVLMTVGTLGMSAAPAMAHANTCYHGTSHHWVSNSTVHWVYYYPSYSYWSGNTHYHWYWVDVYIFGKYWTGYWSKVSCSY